MLWHSATRKKTYRCTLAQCHWEVVVYIGTVPLENILRRMYWQSTSLTVKWISRHRESLTMLKPNTIDKVKDMPLRKNRVHGDRNITDLNRQSTSLTLKWISIHRESLTMLKPNIIAKVKDMPLRKNPVHGDRHL